MLREITPDLFVVEQPFSFLGLELGARLTIVRRENGALWIHAPFAVSPDEEAAIKERGRVRDIIVPNTFHTTQVGEFARRFPDAKVWALPEAETKLRGVPHQPLITLPLDWSEEFDAMLFDGARGFREWAFCHRASQTLLITDLGFHLPRPTTPTARVISILNDVGRRFGPSRLERTLVRLGNTRRTREQMRAVLGWKFSRIVPAHGFVVERDAKKQLRAAYRFVGL